MPGRPTLALLLAALALAGCDDDDNAEPSPSLPRTGTATEPAPEQKQRGVVLRLDRDVANAGDTLRLTVVNNTPARLEYGLMYRLEHFVEGDWRWINRDSAFALILKLAEPGAREREEIHLPNDLEPGRYRIVKEFTAANRELRASVEFEVR